MSTDKPKRRGRPIEYNLELCKEICKKIAEGGNIKSILAKKTAYPDFTTWCRWKRDNGELYNLYINSIQDKSEALIEKIERLEIDLINCKITHSVYNALANTYKWQLAKYYPKMFGDRTQIDLSGGFEATNVVLTEAERKQRIAELIAKAKE